MPKGRKSYWTRCRICLTRTRTELLRYGICRMCWADPANRWLREYGDEA